LSLETVKEVLRLGANNQTTCGKRIDLFDCLIGYRYPVDGIVNLK
jgi:hypothetical protein